MVANLIPASAMSKLREIDERAMQDTCRVVRATASNVGGRTVAGPETAVAVVRCRVAPLGTNPREGARAGRMDAEADGEITVPLGTDLRDTDAIEATVNGRTARYELAGPVIEGTFSTGLVARVRQEG